MIDPLKTLAAARKHRYNKWGGNPEGSAFREGFCAESVQTPERGSLPHQCTRTSGYGPAQLYCKQHNPAAVAARAKASSDRYRSDMDQRFKASDIGALYRAAQLLARSQPDAALACRNLAKKMKETK